MKKNYAPVLFLFLAAACAGPKSRMEAVDDPPCPPGQTDCGDGVYVDLQSDNLNCGACGTACGGGTACTAGVCTVTCLPVETLCGGLCTNLLADDANCGACGAACQRGRVCSDGTCSMDCAAPLTTCGSGVASFCANLTSDNLNCGACGNICPLGGACANSVCLPATLGGLSPARISSAGGATLTITGSGLRSGVTVTIGGTACANPVVNGPGTSLTCTTPAMTKYGAQPVVVTNPGAQPFAPLNVNIFFGHIQFGLPSGGSVVLNGSYLSTVATADFNGDGKPDLVSTDTTTSTYWQTVSLNTTTAGANHVTATNTTMPVSGENYPTVTGAGDFNGDGKADFVVAANNTHGLYAFLGNGAGGFAAAHLNSFASTVSNFDGIAVADLNNDHNADVVLASNGTSVIQVLVLASNADGSFTQHTALTGFNYSIMGLATGDVNLDGNMDIVVLTGYGSLYVYLGNGNFGFTLNQQTAANSYGSPTYTGSFALADFNGDHVLDAVTINANNTLAIGFGHTGASLGTFTTTPTLLNPTITSGSYGARTLTVGDFDLDGSIDIALGDRTWSQLHILTNDGAGNFPSSGMSYWGAFNLALWMTTADFNGDGKLDVASAGWDSTSHTVQVMLNNSY